MTTLQKNAATNEGKALDFTLALLLFLPTLFFVPYWANVLLFVLFVSFAHRRIQLDTRDMLLVGFIFLSLVNLAFGVSHYRPDKHGFFLAILFMPFNVWIGRGFNVRIIRHLVTFTLIEAWVVIVEMATGHQYFFTAQERMSHAGGDSEGMLYFLRPLGLSENSSAIALKVMLAILFLLAIPNLFEKRKLKFFILGLATLFTFNRTAMGALAFLGVWLYLSWLWSVRHRPGRWVRHLGAWAVVTLAVAAVIGDLIFQFTRGSTDVQGSLTGRPYIWSRTLEFIHQNPLVGNHGLPFRTLSLAGNVAHAHNSFLQVYATHGVLGLLLIAYPIWFLRKWNLPYALTLAVFSLTQYGLFWNFSYIDTVLYFFLSSAFLAMAEKPFKQPADVAEPV